MATLEWAAGFIDGEGCIDIYKTGRTQYLVRLQITNTHLPALKELQSLFVGGKIYPKTSKYPNALPAYQLVWVGKKAVAPILAALFPHLVVKKEQVDFILTSWMPRILDTRKKLTAEELEIRKNLKETLASMKREAYIQ